MHRMRTVLLLASLCLFGGTGCTEIGSLTSQESPMIIPPMFSHTHFERVLERFVNRQGQVDYAALKKDLHDLEQYYRLFATSSPDNHPELFPTEHGKLAYWINVYNAAVIKAVVTHYPIQSVEDVKPPSLLFFLPRKSGFFLFQRLTFGGIQTSLYYLEHYVIRKRFADPRIHFALNCASGGCPRLPRQAFTAEHLDTQLDQAARQFMTEKRNLVIDHQAKTVWLSSIFDWYKKDFVGWYERKFASTGKASLLDYVSLYASLEQAQELKHAASYTLRFVPYDWSLNDQARDS